MDDKILQEILSGIKNLSNDMGAVKSEIKNLNNRMDTVDGKLDEQRDILRALEHRTEVNSAELSFMKEDIKDIKGDISRINNRLDYQVSEIAKTKEEISILKVMK